MVFYKSPAIIPAISLIVGLLNSTAVAAALTENEAKGFKLTKTVCSDTFEEPAQREGAPEIFRAPISNGLLEYTSQARYAAKGSSELGFKRRRLQAANVGFSLTDSVSIPWKAVLSRYCARRQQVRFRYSLDGCRIRRSFAKFSTQSASPVILNYRSPPFLQM